MSCAFCLAACWWNVTHSALHSPCACNLSIPCVWCVARVVQAYSKPPPLVDMTLSGVMTVLKRAGTWEEAKKALGDANFMSKLLNYDKVGQVEGMNCSC